MAKKDGFLDPASGCGEDVKVEGLQPLFRKVKSAVLACLPAQSCMLNLPV